MIAEFALIVVGTVHTLAGLPITQEDFSTLIDQDMCVEYIDDAVAAGWPSHELPRLMRVMHRESRCIPEACGVTDSPEIRKCRDWGLMQINDYSWKTTIRGMGYHIEEMWDPYTNLVFAKWLFDLAEDVYGCGWQPWNLKC